MEILSVSGVSMITSDTGASHEFYRDALGLPLEKFNDDYHGVNGFEGANHLGVWPLSMAAQSCFGQPEWPDHVPVPQAAIGFEVADVEAVEAAAAELESKGFELIHGARTEPWGLDIARLLGPEGLLIGITYTHNQPDN